MNGMERDGYADLIVCEKCRERKKENEKAKQDKEIEKMVEEEMRREGK